MKFNNWHVLEEVGKDKRGSYLYLCECLCGNKRIVNGSNLRSGHTKSCGCYVPEYKGYEKDLTGIKFNDIEVISFSHTEHSHSKWNCICHKCNNTFTLIVGEINKKIECKVCKENEVNINSLLKQNEIMKPIENLKNYYVSNYGNIYSNKRGWKKLKQSIHNRI